MFIPFQIESGTMVWSPGTYLVDIFSYEMMLDRARSETVGYDRGNGIFGIIQLQGYPGFV